MSGYNSGEPSCLATEYEAESSHSGVLQPGVYLEHSSKHVRVFFDQSRQMLSSAVLMGGLVNARQIVNMKVNAHGCEREYESPQLTLKNYCSERQWDENGVGMMTAASMDSLRVVQSVVQGVALTVLVTAGVTNARRAGDRAEWRQVKAIPHQQGTINTIIILSARLTQTALVEALVVATEAKAAAMQQSAIISPVSQQIATGTGTDSIVLSNGTGSEDIAYCGKHMVLGESIARMVIEATCSSLEYEVTG